MATTRASGVMPSSLARTSLMITNAAAPSFNGQALPAVTVPSTWNTGFNPANPSSVVPARGHSSAVITVPSGNVTGVISLAQNPFANALAANVWERNANSSCSALVIPR